MNCENIKIYSLKNEFLEIEVLNLGAIIKKIELSDKNGIKRNIVLSYENLEDYKKNVAYLGAVVGRTAGRIEKGLLKLPNGNNRQLTINNGENNLHGGFDSISHKIWNVKKIKNGLELSINSSANENGYPANLEIVVKYILEKRELRIEYFAKADDLTYVNLTNHSYFNLNGCDKIYNHNLKLVSDYMLGLNENFMPKKLINLKDSIFNFNNEKSLAKFFTEEDEQKKLVNNGIDHPFIIKNKNFAELTCLENGIQVQVETNNPGVVIYTGNFLAETGFENHSGICFETQEIPNLYKNKELNIFPTFIDEGKNYKRYTKFIFKVL